MALKLDISLNLIFLSSAPFTIASPRGCSEPFSLLAAIDNNSSSDIVVVIISVTTGLPSVIVPVLSNTIVSIWWVTSKASPPLINTPYSAPFPVPTIIAVGVASPNAHGQAITKTEINIVNANTPLSPAINHPILASIARPITIGTKYDAIISAIFAIGAFDPWASSTNLIIWDNAVSLPTLVALYLINPVLLILAPITLLPTVFSTGILSPVSIASSTAVAPSITSPSTGNFSPGLTITISPTITSSIGITNSFPSLTIVAVFGANPISFLIAWDVFPLEIASRYLPKVIKASIVTAAS